MRMKKFLQLSAAAAALTLTLTMGVTALADTVKVYWGTTLNTTTLSRTKSVDITANPTKLYYNVTKNEVWDRDEFKVKTETTGSWDNNGESTITVTNKSDIGVTATMTFTDGGFSGNYFDTSFSTQPTGGHKLQPKDMEGSQATATITITNTNDAELLKSYSDHTATGSSTASGLTLGSVLVTLS